MIKSFTEFPKKQNYEHKNEVVRINYFHQFETERKSVPIERKERVEHVKSMVLKFSEDQDPKDEVLLKTKLFGSCETCNTSHLHYYVCHSCGAKTCEKCLKPILLNFTKENNQQIQHKPTLCPRCIHDCYIILNRSLWWIYNTKPPLVEQKRDIIARAAYKLNLIDFLCDMVMATVPALIRKLLLDFLKPYLRAFIDGALVNHRQKYFGWLITQGARVS